MAVLMPGNFNKENFGVGDQLNLIPFGGPMGLVYGKVAVPAGAKLASYLAGKLPSFVTHGARLIRRGMETVSELGYGFWKAVGGQGLEQSFVKVSSHIADLLGVPRSKMWLAPIKDHTGRIVGAEPHHVFLSPTTLAEAMRGWGPKEWDILLRQGSGRWEMQQLAEQYFALKQTSDMAKFLPLQPLEPFFHYIRAAPKHGVP